MDFIKKQFVRPTVTGSTTGGTVILPDTGTSFNIKVLFTKKSFDWGFFDVYEDPLATGATGSSISHGSFTVTGNTTSRLSELRKYTISGTLQQMYFTSVAPEFGNGVNPNLTITGNSASTFVYYIDGITFTEIIPSGATTGNTIFSFVSSGFSTPSVINKPIIKDENKQNIIGKPKVDDNVFIIRQELSVLENNYRLQNINNLAQLTFYAGGGFFNIVENT